MKESTQASLRWVAMGGVVLVVGIVGWRLTSGSYKGDIEKICQAERNAGASADKEPRLVSDWTKEHLDTPEGSSFYSDLGKKSLPDRAKALDAEAKRLGVAECPIVKSFAARQTESDVKTDLRLLCSLAAVPDIDKDKEDDRVAKLQAWAASSAARSPRTKDILAKVAAAEPSARGDALRAAANDESIYGCELANILGKAPAVEHGDAYIRLVRAEINGDMTEEQAFQAILANMEPFRKCYESAESRDKAIGGPITVRFTLELGGKVDTSKGLSGPDKESTECMAKAVSTVKFPAVKTRQASVILHMEFVPATRPDAGAPDAASDAASRRD